MNVAVWYIGVALAPYWSFVSTAAQRVEKRQFAERASRCSASDWGFEGVEKMEVAKDVSEGVGGVVIVLGEVGRDREQ